MANASPHPTPLPANDTFLPPTHHPPTPPGPPSTTITIPRTLGTADTSPPSRSQPTLQLLRAGPTAPVLDEKACRPYSRFSGLIQDFVLGPHRKRVPPARPIMVIFLDATQVVRMRRPLKSARLSIQRGCWDNACSAGLSRTSTRIKIKGSSMEGHGALDPSCGPF